MFDPKRISKAAIPMALDKALRYRLLNQPAQAESICRDVLLVDPYNQTACITLLLALTDQFETEFAAALDDAQQVLQQIEGSYQQLYYKGIINERWAMAQSQRGMPGHFALGWMREAMHCYEQAEPLSEPDDPDVILRWNSCARFLERHADTTPAASSTQSSMHSNMTQDIDAGFGGDVPPR